MAFAFWSMSAVSIVVRFYVLRHSTTTSYICLRVHRPRDVRLTCRGNECRRLKTYIPIIDVSTQCLN